MVSFQIVYLFFFFLVGHHRISLRSSSLREKRGGGHPHKPPPRSRHHRESKMKKSQSSPTQLAQASTSDDEGEEEAALTSLHSLSIQLLDLMHTLHTRAASIFAAWAQEGSENNGGGKPIDAATGTLWATCWCPLLQGESPVGAWGGWRRGVGVLCIKYIACFRILVSNWCSAPGLVFWS